LKKRNLNLGEVERLAILGLRYDDILICASVEPQTAKEHDQIALAIEIGRARGIAEIEEALATLCRQGNRAALAWWSRSRGSRFPG
jgi:hypothetical protein